MADVNYGVGLTNILNLPLPLPRCFSGTLACVSSTLPINRDSHPHRSKVDGTKIFRKIILPFWYSTYSIFLNTVTWRIITDSGLGDWIYWHLLLQSLLITINYNISQSMTAYELLRFYWTTSVFPSMVTDLVLTNKSVTSSASLVPVNTFQLITQSLLHSEWLLI
jgi:hypothetical protein